MRTMAFLALVVAAAGCAEVRPWERGRLASPAMQFAYDPVAEGEDDSVQSITEGGTFAGTGPGGAGAGCGCH